MRKTKAQKAAEKAADVKMKHLCDENKRLQTQASGQGNRPPLVVA